MVCRQLTHDFWTPLRLAILTVNLERFCQFTERELGTWARDADAFQHCESSLLCISAASCPTETARTSLVSPALAQARPLPRGHTRRRAILCGCRSKVQSSSSQELMRISAFGIFMETGSCPKHIPREWIFQKYEFSLPHTKTFIVRPGSTPQQNIGKRKH